MSMLGDKIREEAKGRVKSAGEFMVYAAGLNVLASEVDGMEAQENFRSLFGYGGFLQLELRPDLTPQEASRSLRAFVKATGITLKKSFQAVYGTFKATGERGDLRLEITDFVPQECHITLKKRWVEAFEQTYYESECNPPGAGEAAVTANEPEEVASAKPAG